MHVTTLSHTPIEKVVHCLSHSFQGYFVELPSDVDFWAKRFTYARVNWNHSWGVFDGDQLVGFVVHALDQEGGVYTAYNTGTGILPAYRGKQWVDQLYAYGLPRLHEAGVRRCTLEVIDQNHTAIRVYERIGFRRKRALHSFRGTLPHHNGSHLVECPLDDVLTTKVDHRYSWDYQSATIRKAGNLYCAYRVFDPKSQNCGHVILNPETGRIAQLESEQDAWHDLLQGIAQLRSDINMANVTEDRRKLLATFKELDVSLTLTQYEMEMDLNPSRERIS